MIDKKEDIELCEVNIGTQENLEKPRIIQISLDFKN